VPDLPSTRTASGTLPLDSFKEPPLVIDLDGTLLRSDLLLETGLLFLRANPLRLFLPLWWLTKGKAYLKESLARATVVDVTQLPYDPEIIALIGTERAKGREVILATASHRCLAERVAGYLGLFDEVIATDGSRNLSAHRKKDALVERYGEGGYDYAGNSRDDLPVLKAARRAILVNPEPGVERRSRGQGNVAAVIRSNPTSMRDWIKAIRLHQWMKNLLIFVPLLAAHRATDIELLGRGALAFVIFGLCASSVYVLNDLLDLGDDRHHPTKRHRPFASGKLQIKSGAIASGMLLATALVAALLWLPADFVAVLAVYYALTLAYSLVLKRLMVVDVIVLASLYTVRLIAGAAAFGVELTFWILAFAMFMFLSLALVKRYAELLQARVNGQTGKSRGRGYYPGDLEMIASLGGASGYLSVLVLALYIDGLKWGGLYRQPEFIWLACPLLLFWVSRVWMLTHRGEMHDDPVLFAIRDPASLAVGLLFALVFWIAT
jgi:4-hydroxybenzoate polyprenyltransferase